MTISEYNIIVIEYSTIAYFLEPHTSIIYNNIIKI